MINKANTVSTYSYNTYHTLQTVTFCQFISPILYNYFSNTILKSKFLRDINFQDMQETVL